MNHVHNFHYHKLSQTQLPQISVSRFQKKNKIGDRFPIQKNAFFRVFWRAFSGFRVILVKPSSVLSLADE